MEFPHLQKIHDEYKGKGAIVAMISIDQERYKVGPFLEKNPNSALMLLSNSEVESAYKVQGIPLTLIIDQKGMIRYRHTGFSPGQETELRGVIEALLN